jgi:hypothetical protein
MSQSGFAVHFMILTVIPVCRTVPLAVVAVTVNKNVPATMLLSVTVPEAGAGAVSVAAWPVWSAQSVRRCCSGNESFTTYLTSKATPTLTGVDGAITTMPNAVEVDGSAGDVGVLSDEAVGLTGDFPHPMTNIIAGTSAVIRLMSRLRRHDRALCPSIKRLESDVR